MAEERETAQEKPSALIHAQMYFDHHALNQMDQITSDYNLRQARSKEALTREQEIHSLDISIHNSISYLQQLKGVAPLLIEELVLSSQEDDLSTEADAFMAALMVFTDNEPARIEPVINEFCAKPLCREGLAVALAWLPLELTRPWLKAFLNSKDLNHKWLACRAFSLMCAYPAESIRKLAEREDCQAHTDLLAAMIKLAGQVRDTRLLPLCADIAEQDDHPLQATAVWSRLLLDKNTAGLREQAITCALQSNENFHCLSDWLLRLCPRQEAKALLGQASKSDALAKDLTLRATAIYGDPAVVTWQLARTEDPALLRWLGFTFMHITGLDITDYKINAELDYDNEALYLDEDYSLPLPDRQKLIDIWRNAHKGFTVGKPYFLGQPQQYSAPTPSPQAASLGFVRHYSAIANTLFGQQPYRYFIMPRKV